MRVEQARESGGQDSGTGSTVEQTEGELGYLELGHPLDSYTSFHSQWKSVWVLARLISIIRVEIAQVCIVTVCAERGVYRECVEGVYREVCVSCIACFDKMAKLHKLNDCN